MYSSSNKLIVNKEKAISVSKDKKKCLQTLNDVKSLQYMNDYAIFFLTQIIDSNKTESTTFSIIDKIEYIIDLYSIKAAEKGIPIVLMREPCFPNEVRGNKNVFELLLATILEYLIQNIFIGKIKLYVKVSSPFEGQLLLGFDFECTSNDILFVENLKNVLMASKTIDMSPVFPINTWQNSNSITKQPALLIKYLEGSFEISDTDDSIIKLEIELPFSTEISMGVQTPENNINIFRVERSREFTKIWTTSIGPSDLTVSPKLSKRTPPITKALTEKKLGEESVKKKLRMEVDKLAQRKSQVLQIGTLSPIQGNSLDINRNSNKH